MTNEQKKEKARLFSEPLLHIVVFSESLETTLLADVLWHGVLVYHEIHGVCDDEVLGHVPNALIVTSRAPRVFHHVVFLAILILCDAIDKHAVVICELPVVETLLTLFLSRLYLWHVHAERVDKVLFL